MDISIDDLKNKESQNTIDVEIIDIEETASDYKKRLGKKISDMSEEEKKKYNSLSQQKKRKKDKVIEETEDDVQDHQRQITLYNQLYVLKEKFPENLESVNIDPDMSSATLNTKKDLIMKIITDRHSHNIVFETMLLGCRSVERSVNYFDIDCLDGLSESTEEYKDEIIPILQEMVLLGDIDTSMLTPQLRLAIIMSSVVVKTIEKNNDKKKNMKLVEALNTSGRGSDAGVVGVIEE